MGEDIRPRRDQDPTAEERAYDEGRGVATLEYRDRIDALTKQIERHQQSIATDVECIKELREQKAALAVKVSDAEWLFDQRWLPLKCKEPADHYSIECRAQTVKALMRGPLWSAIHAAREGDKEDPDEWAGGAKPF